VNTIYIDVNLDSPPHDIFFYFLQYPITLIFNSTGVYLISKSFIESSAAANGGQGSVGAGSAAMTMRAEDLEALRKYKRSKSNVSSSLSVSQHLITYARYYDLPSVACIYTYMYMYIYTRIPTVCHSLNGEYRLIEGLAKDVKLGTQNIPSLKTSCFLYQHLLVMVHVVITVTMSEKWLSVV
jgi:hypothetical protein